MREKSVSVGGGLALRFNIDQTTERVKSAVQIRTQVRKQEQ